MLHFGAGLLSDFEIVVHSKDIFRKIAEHRIFRSVTVLNSKR